MTMTFRRSADLKCMRAVLSGALAALMVMCGFMLVGCGASGVAGDWWTAYEENPGEVVFLHIVLAADGTATMQRQLEVPAEYWPAPLEVNRGTWTQKDATVTVAWAGSGQVLPRAYTYSKQASGVEALLQASGDYYRTQAIAKEHTDLYVKP